MTAPNQNQSRRVVERQLRRAETKLANKQAALATMTTTPHKVRCQREIAGIKAQILEYRDWLSAQDRSAAAAMLGSAKSERKTAAARENGKRGGRPRKV